MRKKDNLLKAILNSVVPVVLAFVIGAFIILAIGEDPFETYGILTVSYTHLTLPTN